MDVFSDPLPSGTILLNGQYQIKEFLNDGGFGITYLATDSLKRPMVIKECFPRAICRRNGLEVGTSALSHKAEFRSIVKAFIEEAKNLSKFEHPSIVKVHQVFDENQTAYMAMDYVDGQDLIALIDQQELSIDTIVSITLKLLDALKTIHNNDMLHRDISPDNILIDKNQNPVLIDFGAAKEEASHHGPKMTSIRVTKEGYSPQEFYVSGAQQFPSSDLYALAATIYHAITGSAPAESQARLLALAQEKPDPYVPLAGTIPNYPIRFLEAIDQALNIAPKDRLPSAEDWLTKMKQPSLGKTKSTSKRLLIAGSGALALCLFLLFSTQNNFLTNQLPFLSFGEKPVETEQPILNYRAPIPDRKPTLYFELPFSLQKAAGQGVKITQVFDWVDANFSGHWIKPNIHIISVNKKIVTNIDDIQMALSNAKDIELSEINTSTIEYTSSNQSNPISDTVTLRPTGAQSFSNGMVLQQQYRGQNWQIIVIEPPSGINTDIQAGDILLAERLIERSVLTLNEFKEILLELEARNLPKGVFSVRRNGAFELANLPLEVENDGS